MSAGLKTEAPLAGLRVVVCRPADQAGALARRLEAAGAEAVLAPVIAITGPEDGGAALRAALRGLAPGDWLVVTSANGAARAAAQGPLPEGVRVAAIGPATARRAAEEGLRVALVPKRSIAEGLLEEFPDPPRGQASAGMPSSFRNTGAGGGRGRPEAPVASVDGGAGRGRSEAAKPERSRRKVVLARAAQARAALPDGLRAAGWEVADVAAYRTVGAVLTDEQRRRVARADAVAFTSSSTVKHLLAQVGAGSVPPLVASIGPATTAAVRRHGLDVTVEAADHNTDGMIAALCQHRTT